MLSFKFKSRINISVFIVSILFYSSIDIGETWFWISSSVTYVIGFAAFILAFAEIHNKEKDFVSYTLLILSSIYLGGANSALGVFYLLCLAVSFVLSFFGDLYSVRSKLLLSFGLSFISLIILIVGSGNINRLEVVSEMKGYENTIWRSLIMNFLYTGAIILLRMVKIIPVLLLVIAIGALEGIRYKLTFKRSFEVFCLVFASLYFGAIYIYNLSIVYAINSLAAPRTLYFAAFISVVFAFLFGFNIHLYFGQRLRQYNRIVKNFLIAFIVISSVLIPVHIWLGLRYTKALEQRIELVNSERKNCKDLVVKPLPYCGMLNSAELSSNPEYFSNIHFKEAHKMCGDVLVDFGEE